MSQSSDFRGSCPPEFIFSRPHPVDRKLLCTGRTSDFSRSEKKMINLEEQVDVETIKSMNALYSLYSGKPLSACDEEPGNLPVSHDEFKSVRDRVRISLCESAGSTLKEVDAYASICKTGSGGLGYSSFPEGRGALVPSTNQLSTGGNGVPAAINRGDVVPACIDCIDIPDVKKGTLNFDTSELFSGLVPSIFTEGAAHELIDFSKLDDISQRMEDLPNCYADPLLAPGGTGLNELCALLLLKKVCKLCNPILPAGFGIRIFTVSKGSTGPRSQRMIWDARRTSFVCFEPPKAKQGSLAALSELDIEGSVESINLGVSDVACYFYSLQGILSGFENLLFLEGVKIESVRDVLRKWLLDAISPSTARPAVFEPDDIRCDACAIREVLNLDWENFSGIGCSAPAMGFSWSPYLAQSITNAVTDRVNVGDQGKPIFQIAHKGVNEWHSNHAVMNYLDDILSIARHERKRHDLLFSIKSEFEQQNLSTHKDQLGDHNLSRSDLIQGVKQRVTTLGVSFDLVENDGCFSLVVRPLAEKLNRLVLATQFFLKQTRVKFKHVERLLGSWAWLLQLRRPLYSVLSEVYKLRGVGEEFVCIPASVKREFEILIRLRFHLSAEISKKYSKSIFCVDAGPEFGAVIKADVEQEFSFSSSILHADFVGKWRLIIQYRWRVYTHNNVTEGFCILWAARCSPKNTKTVVFTDSMVMIGAYNKGRSSSWGINRLCQKYCVICVVNGIILKLKYVESACNFADGPSRGELYPCVAQATLRKAV